MRVRNVVAALIAIVWAVACIQLGRWQLRRLAQRRARNAEVMTRLASAPVGLSALPADTARARFRRLRVAGRFDYDHEVAIAGRSHEGAPGVEIITPYRLTGSGRTVLVNRGWVYSPDAATVELSRWQEPEPATVGGFVQEFEPPAPRAPQPGHRLFRRIDANIAAAMPYDVEPFVLVELDSAASGAPARLAVPALDEGPHRSYAIQWFSFGAIAVVGVGILIWQDITKRRAGLAP